MPVPLVLIIMITIIIIILPIGWWSYPSKNKLQKDTSFRIKLCAVKTYIMEIRNWTNNGAVHLLHHVYYFIPHPLRKTVACVRQSWRTAATLPCVAPLKEEGSSRLTTSHTQRKLTKRERESYLQEDSKYSSITCTILIFITDKNHCIFLKWIFYFLRFRMIYISSWYWT